jgi:hypothetical protein
MPDINQMVTQLFQDMAELKIISKKFNDVLIGTEKDKGLIQRVIDLEREILKWNKIMWIVLSTIITATVSYIVTTIIR